MLQAIGLPWQGPMWQPNARARSARRNQLGDWCSPVPTEQEDLVEVMGLCSNPFRCSMNRSRNFSTATLTSLQWASVFKLGVQSSAKLTCRKPVILQRASSDQRVPGLRRVREARGVLPEFNSAALNRCAHQLLSTAGQAQASCGCRTRTECGDVSFTLGTVMAGSPWGHDGSREAGR